MCLHGNDTDLPSCDLALCYTMDQMKFFCCFNNLRDSVLMSLFYKADRRTEMAASCTVVPGSNQLPLYDFGIKVKPTKDAVLRAKINGDAVLSGSFKVDINKEITVNGMISVDVKKPDWSASKLGVGIEFSCSSVCYHDPKQRGPTPESGV